MGRLRGQAPVKPLAIRAGAEAAVEDRVEGGLHMSAMETDVVIVGGGLVGCAAALHLRARGASVAVVEKNQLGAAASGVNFGGVRRNGRKLAELPIAARALEVWKRLPELVGSDCEYEITGNIKVARTDEDMAQIAAHAEAQAEYGVEVQMLGRNALRDRYPWLGPERPRRRLLCERRAGQPAPGGPRLRARGAGSRRDPDRA